MRYIVQAAALLSLFSFGANLTAAPLSLPAQGEVTEVVTTWKDGIHEQDQISRITDPTQIEAVIEVMKTLNFALSKPWKNFAKPQYVTMFLHGSSEVLVVFVGVNWIGGREGYASSAHIRMRHITAEQRQQFLSTIVIQ
jgi:hypothetical protein